MMGLEILVITIFASWLVLGLLGLYFIISIVYSDLKNYLNKRRK